MIIIISPCKLAEPRVGNLLKHSPHHLVPATIVTIIIVTIIIIIIVTITTNVITSMIILISINTPLTCAVRESGPLPTIRKALSTGFVKKHPSHHQHHKAFINMIFLNNMSIKIKMVIVIIRDLT